MNWRFFWLIIVCIPHFSLYGQFEDVEFANLSVHNGLSNNDINSIVQDKDGFIWFGTEYGLNRYDGYEIKVYPNIPGDSTSLPDNSINCLYIDSYGTLWIGTSRGGLAKYVKSSDTFISYLHDDNDTNSISYNYITFITEDKYQNLWIATLEGLNLYNRKNNNFRQYITEKYRNNSKETTTDYGSGGYSVYLKDIGIRSMTADEAGNLWIGYERAGLGFLNIKEGVFTHFPITLEEFNDVAENSIQNVLILDNEVWLATRFSGVIIFDKVKKEYRKLVSDKIDERVTALKRDTADKIWIGTKKGLYNYNKTTGFVLSYYHLDCEQHSLSNNSISCLFKDRQGILWAGTLQGGVNYTINQKGFRTFKLELCKDFGLSQASVSSILVDSKDNLWIGYFDNGIDVINKKNFKKKFYYDFPTRKGPVSTGTIFCIFEDSKGFIWIGTYASGLFKYDPKTGYFKNYRYIEGDSASISGNDIRSICEDSEHQLWLAVHGNGINRFNPETEKAIHIKYKENNYGVTRASNWVYKVHFDNKNQLWVTSVAGVSLSKNLGKFFTNYNHNQDNANSESLDVIWTLFDDGDNLWMGSNMGLSVFDKEKKLFTRVFTKSDGLPIDAIAGILSDEKGNLWISTFSGLVKLNPKDFKMKVYNKTDGLQDDQFFANACYKDRNGEMYFGGINGLTTFLPERIKEEEYIPPVFFTDFKLFNKSENHKDSKILKSNISETKEIKLKYSQNVITFNFVALNFVEPEKNQYAYKLEGFEKDWNMAGDRREATYTSLSPGSYIFRVKASNNDGVWNNEGASIKIRVLPPFWLSCWAFIIYAAIVVIILILYKRNIQKTEALKRNLAIEHMEAEKKNEMNNMRLKFFTNISHEFRTSLSLIIGPTEKLLADLPPDKKELKNDLSHIKQNAQRLLRLINQLLDIRKIETGNFKIYPSPGDIISFCIELGKTFESIAKENKIKYTIDCQVRSLYAWFDADKIEKILYNLLFNAFKFTKEGGTVSLLIGIVDSEEEKLSGTKRISIVVSDTGVGISKENIGNIFNRFFQVERKNYKAKGGTGIGLSLVKELVDMHGGSIQVRSNETSGNPGSTFYVILPLDIRDTDPEILENPINNESLSDNEPDNIKASKKSKNKTSSDLPHILLVEDNPEMRMFIIEMLKNEYRFSEAENGISGLKAAMDLLPDLIISDIMMPGMHGKELCKTLKSDERTSHIPIVILTALDSVENRISGFETGADEYLTKPFNAGLLKTRIHNLLENRKNMRERFSKQVFVEAKEISITSVDEKFITKAIEVVDKHIDDPLFDVDAFTKELLVSRTLLHTKLKALTGQSTTEFIKTIRLKRAVKLLTEGKLSVSEVSVMVGFNSRNYFTKCFTEQFGVSPSEYGKVEEIS